MAHSITISTKKGDSGSSYLANGQNHPKDSSFFATLGDLDELNSHIGLVVATLRSNNLSQPLQEIVLQLEQIQKNLYVISGVIAGAAIELPKAELAAIEALGFELQTKMADGWTTQFLYPGGSVIGAQLDVARAVCRRAERVLFAHARVVPVPKTVLHYMNRLSDHLFILRCFANQELGVAEKKFSRS